MTTTTPAAELRAAAEAVIERHHPTKFDLWWTEIDGVPHRVKVCVHCSEKVPCSAHRMASALLEAAEGLEWYATGHDNDKATAALAAAAARLEATSE